MSPLETSPLANNPPLFPELFRDDVFHFETRRLWLRWPSLQDADAMQAVVLREQIARDGASWLSRPAAIEPLSCIAEARASNEAGRRLDLALARKSKPNELIGLIGVRPLARPKLLTLGFVLDVEHQGQGLMTEAVRALVGAVFHYTECEAIRGSHSNSNAATRRVLEKAGFRCVQQRASAHLRDDCRSMELRRGTRPVAPLGVRRDEPLAVGTSCGCGA